MGFLIFENRFVNWRFVVSYEYNYLQTIIAEITGLSSFKQNYNTKTNQVYNAFITLIKVSVKRLSENALNHSHQILSHLHLHLLIIILQ